MPLLKMDPTPTPILASSLVFDTGFMDDKTNGAQDLESPNFFFEQTGKLQKLLDTVVEEAKTATDPQASIDFLELTEILTTLLQESQLYSVLSSEDLRLQRDRIGPFLDKIQTVQDAVADWDERTTSTSPEAPVTPTRLRKRNRTRTVESGETRVLRSSKKRLVSEVGPSK